MRLTGDQLLDWSRNSRLKVQQLGPHLRLKSIPLVGSDTLSRCSEVFGRYAVHYIDGRGTSHEPHMRRKRIRINGECHLRICFQCRHFGRVRNRYKEHTEHRSSPPSQGPLQDAEDARFRQRQSGGVPAVKSVSGPHWEDATTSPEPTPAWACDCDSMWRP